MITRWPHAYLKGFVERLFVMRLRRPNVIPDAQLHVFHGQTLHDEILIHRFGRAPPGVGRFGLGEFLGPG